MRNIYDNSEFFAAYAEMGRSKDGLKAAGEWHQLQPLFPKLQGKKVLDLGCGYGWHCKYAAQMGATEILGIDSSQKMIAKAVADNSDDKIKYKVCGVEEYIYPENTYDLVVSNLVLHYIENLANVYQKVYCTLKVGGYFLFNIEHPTFTAGVNEDWIYDENGKPKYWPIDNYYYPGERETNFLGQRVIKQHHTSGFKLSVGKNYKFIERYISEDLWEKLLSTYRMDSYENIWEALFLCHQLFRAVSGEVAERLHYAYPEYDRNITKYTRDMYKKYTGKTGCLDSTYAADIEERREQ